MNGYQKTIFSIGLLTVTLSNISWYLYAVSNRSWIIGCVFILAAYLIARQDPKTASRFPYSQPIYKIGSHISLLLFIPYFVYNLSALLEFPSIYLLGLPFVAVLDPTMNMSMKEGLKALLDMLF